MRGDRNRKICGGVDWPPAWLDGVEDEDMESLPPRPATRRDCVNGPRPCAWVGCRFHLYLDVVGQGRLVADFSTPPWQMKHSCALDVIDKHEKGLTLEAVGKLFDMTRQGASVAQKGAERRLKEITNRIDGSCGADGNNAENIFVRQAAASGMPAEDLADFADFMAAASLSDTEKTALGRQTIRFHSQPLSRDTEKARREERNHV